MAKTPDQTTPRVFVGLPNYDGRIEVETAASWLLGLTAGRCHVGQFSHSSSLLANGFNSLWCQALNLAAKGECNRFAMLHADVVPERGPWLDRLEKILQETDADVVSVVIPIKTTEGLTSTAIGDPADPWRTVKRLTMSEVVNLPQTFTAADCGFPGYPLLVNTGLWLARLDRGNWQRKVHFEIRDRIVVEGQELKPQCIPEDWGWGRQMWELGVKVVATRALPVEHVGRMRYTNRTGWGQLAVDYNYDPIRDPAVQTEREDG